MARVVVLAGPSGAGKSRLAERLGLPVVRLDDFYRSDGDPALPRRADGLVDWDDPASWLHDEAVEALERLCRDGAVDVPVYDLSRSGRVGHHELRLDGASLVVAEGIFAQELVADCRARGLLAEALCVTQHPATTFVRRLLRDLRERRKAPPVLVRRGLRLARAQRAVVAYAVALGCEAVSAQEAERRVAALAEHASR